MRTSHLTTHSTPAVLARVPHLNQIIKPIVALLTFSIGVTASQADMYAAVLFSPVAIFLLFHFVLVGVVVHQLLIRANNRSQVIGKGILAEVVWLLPSFIVAFISMGYLMSFSRRANISPLAVIVIGATTFCYGLIGLGLFRWVRNSGNEGLGIWKRKRCGISSADT